MGVRISEIKATIAAKRSLAFFVSALGFIERKLRASSGSDSVILMYHRVISKQQGHNWVQEGMYVKPETFKLHLQFLQEHFRIISIAEYYDETSKGGNGIPKKPSCLLTFDDGWQDFYQNAFPLLQSFGVPATVFLATDFVGTKRWFWTDRLCWLLQNCNEKFKEAQCPAIDTTHPFMAHLQKLRGSQKNELDQFIEFLKRHKQSEIDEFLDYLSATFEVDSSPPGRAFLSWEEIQELHSSGLVSFGSHTATHRILTTLTDQEIWDEFHHSKRELMDAGVVDVSFVPFCYPNGNYNGRILDLIKETGYHLAVTTTSGWNSADADPLTLRRIALHQDMASTKPMLGCRILGWL